MEEEKEREGTGNNPEVDGLSDLEEYENVRSGGGSNRDDKLSSVSREGNEREYSPVSPDAADDRGGLSPITPEHSETRHSYSEKSLDQDQVSEDSKYSDRSEVESESHASGSESRRPHGGGYQDRAKRAYRTIPCRFYASKGWCKYGDECRFKHVELPEYPAPPVHGDFPRTDPAAHLHRGNRQEEGRIICKFYASQGFCKFENNCKYSHVEDHQRRAFQPRHISDERRMRYDMHPSHASHRREEGGRSHYRPHHYHHPYPPLPAPPPPQPIPEYHRHETHQPVLCNYWSVNKFCKFGDNCRFVHADDVPPAPRREYQRYQHHQPSKSGYTSLPYQPHDVQFKRSSNKRRGRRSEDSKQSISSGDGHYRHRHHNRHGGTEDFADELKLEAKRQQLMKALEKLERADKISDLESDRTFSKLLARSHSKSKYVRSKKKRLKRSRSESRCSTCESASTNTSSSSSNGRRSSRAKAKIHKQKYRR